MRVIHVATLVVVENRRILLARSRSKDGFYLPGGKINPGESEIEALRREIGEELGCRLDLDVTRLFKRLTAQAFGEPEGVLVSMGAYIGGLVGEPKAQAEIEELRYFTFAEYFQQPLRAAAGEAVLSDLRSQGIIT